MKPTLRLCALFLLLAVLCVACAVPAPETPPVAIDCSALSYAAFGDSITYGADFTNAYVQMPTPYPAAVAKLLGLASHTNYGVGGAVLATNTRGYFSMTEVITSTTEPYDIVSVMGGINDFNAGLPLGTAADTTADTVYGALDVIARHLTTHYPDALLFFMTPYPEYYGGLSTYKKNAAGYYLAQLAQAVKVVAARYDILVLDLYAIGGFETVMYNEDCDGLHPNQDFILAKTAPQIAAFIQKHLA